MWELISWVKAEQIVTYEYNRILLYIKTWIIQKLFELLQENKVRETIYAIIEKKTTG